MSVMRKTLARYPDLTEAVFAGCLRAIRKSLPALLEGAPVHLRCHLRVVPGVGVQKSILEYVRALKNYREKIAGF